MSETELKVCNRDQAEAAMAIVAALTIQLTDKVNVQNAELLAARKHDEKIKELRERKERYEYALEDWAKKNRREFGETKTIELRQGKISTRSLPRSLEFLKGWTQDLVLAKLRKVKRFAIYIRSKESLNLQLILQDTKPEVARLKEADLETMGLQITQGEIFSVCPKLEPVPAATTSKQ